MRNRWTSRGSPEPRRRRLIRGGLTPRSPASPGRPARLRPVRGRSVRVRPAGTCPACFRAARSGVSAVRWLRDRRGRCGTKGPVDPRAADVVPEERGGGGSDKDETESGRLIDSAAESGRGVATALRERRSELMLCMFASVPDEDAGEAADQAPVEAAGWSALRLPAWGERAQDHAGGRTTPSAAGADSGSTARGPSTVASARIPWQGHRD